MSINIPFVEALEQMPNHVKFIKQILSSKQSLNDFQTMALNQECSVVL